MTCGRRTERGAHALRWIRAGVGAGLATCLAYPALLFAPLPRGLLPAVAAILGPALAVASLGLAELLRIERESVLARLGALFNVLGGLCFEAMVLVQLAVRMRAGDEDLARQSVGVWLGLDVAWDVYVGLGTACFALAMLGHPRFGRLVGALGLALAAAVLALNLATFPTPPAEAGLVDVGPALGLWYLAVTLLAWRSLGWARERIRTAGELPPA